MIKDPDSNEGIIQQALFRILRKKSAAIQLPEIDISINGKEIHLSIPNSRLGMFIEGQPFTPAETSPEEPPIEAHSLEEVAGLLRKRWREIKGNRPYLLDFIQEELEIKTQGFGTTSDTHTTFIFKGNKMVSEMVQACREYLNRSPRNPDSPAVG